MTVNAVVEFNSKHIVTDQTEYEPSENSAKKLDDDISLVSGTALHGIPAEIRAEVEKAVDVQQQAAAAKQLAAVIATLNCAIDQYGQFVLQTVVGQRSEVLPIDYLAGQDAIRASMKSVSGRLPSKTALEKIIAEIRIEARASGRRLTTYQRIGRLGDTYVIDLGDPVGRAIHIKNGHWQLVANAGCAFTRPSGYTQLPMPVSVGSVRDAFQLLFTFIEDLGIPKIRIPLVIIALVCWLKEGVTYPVLSLYGPSGSGKSTAGLLLLMLIDPPAKPQIPTIEQEDEHLAAAAQAKHVLSIDNASKFSARFQDRLCTCSTGSEIHKRQLYTNGGVAVLPIHRPVLVTSVNHVITRPDLLTRTVSVEFQPRDKRTDVKSLVDNFEVQAGKLFGALLELVAASTVPLAGENSQGHRLHDFCIAGQRVFAATGVDPDKFMKFVDRMRSSTGAEIASGDTFVIAMREVLTDLQAKAIPGAQLPGWKSWFPSNMASVIDAKGGCVVGIRPNCLVIMVRTKHGPSLANDWIPKNVRDMAGALLRATPILNDIGIKVAKREPSAGNSYWEFTFNAKQANEDA